MKLLNALTILILSLVVIFLSGCQGLRDNLTLKKKQNTDEFLVQKKNPLILPPNYQELPNPAKEKKNINNNDNEKEIDLSKVFDNSKNSEIKNNTEINSSLEESIRKKIGND